MAKKTIKSQFVKSAVFVEDYPLADRPEIAMVGRSNAGKSSLLNTMVGSEAIAKVSQNPGKTRLINFFNIGNNYRLVDLPGYGFARTGQEEKYLWRDMLDSYFNKRETLLGVILVCDVRRKWQPDEELILQLCQQRNLKMLLALTKIDKLNNSELSIKKKEWKKNVNLAQEDIHFISNLKKIGVKELEDYIFKNWVKKV